MNGNGSRMDVGRKAQKIDQLRREPNRRRLEKCQEPSIEQRLVTLPGPREARCLFEAVSTYRERPERMFDKVLAPAMATWSDFADVYARYRRFASAPAFARDRDEPWGDLWTFYGLSRVFEWLILGIQDRAGLRLPPNWPGRQPGFVASPERPRAVPSRDDLVRFFAALGMQPMSVYPRYHPFFHEVAVAELDPALDDTLLIEEIWPGFWFGDLVFARAGVRVRCGPAAPFEPAIAARSTLYFAWQRVHRPTYDLSHGWGSSSQWATSFRRDYADGATLRYNVDGHVRLTGDDAVLLPDDRGRDLKHGGDLTFGEQVELLTHRCFVRTDKPSDALWPFDDTYAEPALGPDSIW